MIQKIKVKIKEGLEVEFSGRIEFDSVDDGGGKYDVHDIEIGWPEHTTEREDKLIIIYLHNHDDDEIKEQIIEAYQKSASPF